MFQAARVMSCTPWEAAGMSHNQHPEFWQAWSLAIASDEAKAAEYKRRQNQPKNKAR